MKFERFGQIGSKSKAAVKTAATEREMDGGDFVFPVLLWFFLVTIDVTATSLYLVWRALSVLLTTITSKVGNWVNSRVNWIFLGTRRQNWIFGEYLLTPGHQKKMIPLISDSTQVLLQLTYRSRILVTIGSDSRNGWHDLTRPYPCCPHLCWSWEFRTPNWPFLEKNSTQT